MIVPASTVPPPEFTLPTVATISYLALSNALAYLKVKVAGPVSGLIERARACFEALG